MRISEVLDAPVVDRTGRQIGVVRDLRVVREQRFRVTGITIGQPGWIDRAAHVWGFADGRARGPGPLRKLTARATRRARFAPVEVIDSWGPDRLVLAAGLKELHRPNEPGSR